MEDSQSTLLVASWDAIDEGAAAMGVPSGVDPGGARVLFITFRRSAAAGSERWRSAVGEPRELVVVAAGTEADPDSAEREGEVLVAEESSDPTWAGVHLNEWLTRWEGDDVDAPIVVHVEGLEALVEETGAETAFRFLHLLVSRVQRADAIGRYVIDPGTCRETTVRTLGHACDAVREYDDGEWT